MGFMKPKEEPAKAPPPTPVTVDSLAERLDLLLAAAESNELLVRRLTDKIEKLESLTQRLNSNFEAGR
jgi:hypothetical protein